MRGARYLWGSLPFIGRLLVTASIALLVAGAAMLFVSARQEAMEIREDLRTELSKELEILPAALAETVVVGDFATLQQTLDRYVARPLIASVEFQDLSGIRLTSEEPVSRSEAPAWFLTLFEFSDVAGSAGVLVGGRSYGKLHLTLTAQRLATRAWSHLISHLEILLLAVALDFIGIWLVLRQGLAPLKNLEAGTRALSGGNFDIRLIPEGSTELRSVIASFNHMTEAIHGVQASLKHQQRRLADIIEGTNIGTWEWNVQTGAAEFNERWAEILGYTLDELAPVSIDTCLKLTHPDDLKRSGELLEKHFSGKLPYYECEDRMRHKDGRWIWVLDRGKVASWMPDGKPLLMSGTHQDISARKENEAMLTDARQQAEAASIAKSRFLATMSHEIRTPMNGILGMAQLLLMPNLQDDERRDYARTILNSGQALLTLLNDILDLSKIEAGKYELESGTLDPAQIVHETRALFSEAASRKGVRIESAWSGTPRRYLGDTHRLRQMLANLVGNAIKFTRQGSVRIEAREIELAGGAAKAAILEFAVADTGIGISPDQQPLLFQPFSQADSSVTRKYGGTGLGLSIVRKLARLMGGEAGVTSAAGQGARFWFRIRADRLADGGDSRQSERNGSESNPTSATPGRFSGRVLVVEDNQTNQKVIVALLRKLGLHCVVAEDGQQALDAIAQGDPADLILMDLQMPVMDGYAATERIRCWEEESGRQRRPIIALTADAFEEDRQRCQAIGMDGFLTKPLVLDALKKVLGKWLTEEPAVSRATETPADAAAPPG